MITVSSLRNEPQWVRDALAWPFDFDVTPRDEARELTWFRFPPGSAFRIVAVDGTGGLFGIYRSSAVAKRVVGFVSSEGECGVIADTLPAALAMVISAPYWFDIAKDSGGGQLEEMTRAARYLEEDLREDRPEVLELRPKLLSHFSLARVEEPAASLREAMVSHQGIFEVSASDGEPCGSLINSFTVEANPAWRGRA